ncbi:hypothetical protein GOBAR_DD14209 [Gossypium barbadense]|nr:hypothetical protein GOBAR_DD14209 [Gossypium barbadense]
MEMPLVFESTAIVAIANSFPYASPETDICPVTPTLFFYLIKIYAEADLPEKALNVFYKMLEFNVKPLPRNLNRILELLVSHRNFIMPAFDLFKTAHK